MYNDQTQGNSNKNNFIGLWLACSIMLNIVAGTVIFYLLTSENETKSNLLDLAQPTQSAGLSTPIPIKSNAIPTKGQAHPLNKEYIFPITNDSGEELGKIKYKLVSYEFTNQVVVNGVYNAAVSGDRSILRIDIELSNENNNAVQILAADYMRMKKNDEDKQIAPDIDSDPVEVKPKSVKELSLGFTVNNNDKNLVLSVGELNGSKDVFNIVR